MSKATLYIVYGEDGAVTADVDRSTAIERYVDECGNEYTGVLEMILNTPDPQDRQATLTIPDDPNKKATVTFE